MKKVVEQLEYELYQDLGDLSPQDRDLMLKAITVREQAYAPYSNFLVGSAVLLENGEIVIGSNQENASYPSGLCAERVAVFQAGAQFKGVAIKAIAITGGPREGDMARPVTSCGNCRQAMLEYEHVQNSPIPVLMMGTSGPILKSTSVAQLLPLAFNGSFL